MIDTLSIILYTIFIILICVMALYNIIIVVYFIVKRLFCKHKYETTTNLYGDVINHFGGARSIRRCVHCDKSICWHSLDPNCKEVNKF